MKKKDVNIAESYLSLTNTADRDFAQSRVQTEQSPDCQSFVKIKAIKAIGEEPVYNMEVEKHHNFAVCGGLIVHNCIDATRYAMEFEIGQTSPGIIRIIT